VAHDAQIAATFDGLGRHWDGLDGLVHAIGFAPREAIGGDFLEGLSREGFRGRARHFGLQLPGAGQGGTALDGRAGAARC